MSKMQSRRTIAVLWTATVVPASALLGILMFCSVALIEAAGVSVFVPATSDPWLAGMPDGATASNGDFAPKHSPVEVVELRILGGATLSFDATGLARHSPGLRWTGPDGDPAYWDPHYFLGDENGISDARLPASCLVGVFLDSERPDRTPAPSILGTSLEFVALSPKLKQVFFIGDGTTSSGVRQQFRVPRGATRLFLGTKDGWGWFNNEGGFEVQIIPEPTTTILAILAILVCARRRRTP